ncbi:amidohydrolase [Thermohalobacter berrensis]|uniref:Peptidase M20 domain-containing protein 2 n=1 Tax=Thermohalobacter berrensis TaxID=99594 RepID=A0A419T4B4_9FIRM|nr:amidohydrolase [Thermohalobacter berrensis]RKD32289.1 amidohydrolase [Thermohalobacter berrensis]
MNKEALKKSVCKAIDNNAEYIINIGKRIYDNPELGYKENFATKLVLKEFKRLGLKTKENIAVTGCKGIIKHNDIGPTIGVMGELDAVICKEHPDANKETGAIHACGHNIQIAGMLGTAIGLISSGVLEKLNGNVEFIAVPAEEYVELEYRSRIKDEGKINFFGGKQELIYRGEIDSLDIAIMFHSLDLSSQGKKALIGGSGNGFIGKKVKFIGKESHAGGAPEEGINALNAAMLAINNINAQRETFKDEDKIRVHPIITKGGDIVNIVPADVRMETYVRGKTIESILDANKKVNRSLIAGAKAVGANIEINEIPGYLPLLNNNELDEVFKDNLINFIDKEDIMVGGEFAGSFDFGDVSHLIPSLHPFIGGVKGNLHTRDFKIEDPYLAYIVPAKAIALTIIDLLYDDAKLGKEIIDNFKPKMSKDEYIDFLFSVSKNIIK